MKWKWLAALLPLTLGIVLKLLTSTAWLENPVLYLRGDAGTLALLGGVLLSGIASAFLYQAVRAERRRRPRHSGR